MKEVAKMPRVHIIAPYYQTYPILCDSLRLQTHQDWTLDLIHDGLPLPSFQGEWNRDPRIVVRATPARHNDFGHSLRADGLTKLAQQNPRAEFVVVSNHDNYYVPGFLAMMLSHMGNHQGVYCDAVYNGLKWGVLAAELRLACIDCGCVMVRSQWAIEAGWRSRRHAGDWDWINDMLQRTQDFVRLPRPLFVHN